MAFNPPDVDWSWEGSGRGGNYGKAARETKRSYLDEQIAKGINLGSDEAQRLQRQSEEGREAAIGTATDAYKNAQGATITDELLRTMMAQEQGRTSRGFLEGMDSLRSYLGGAGTIGGGAAAGMASNLELARLGQITDASTTMQIAKAKQDALDKGAEFQRAMGLSQVQSMDPSAIWLNFLGDVSGLRLKQYEVEAGRSAAKDAASAAKDAGWMSLGGSLGGGLANLFIGG